MSNSSKVQNLQGKRIVKLNKFVGGSHDREVQQRSHGGFEFQDQEFKMEALLVQGQQTSGQMENWPSGQRRRQ